MHLRNLLYELFPEHESVSRWSLQNTYTKKENLLINVKMLFYHFWCAFSDHLSLSYAFKLNLE